MTFHQFLAELYRPAYPGMYLEDAMMRVEEAMARAIEKYPDLPEVQDWMHNISIKIAPVWTVNDLDTYIRFLYCAAKYDQTLRDAGDSSAQGWRFATTSYDINRGARKDDTDKPDKPN